MSATISLTESAIFAALGTVLDTFGLTSSTSGQSVPIVQGQINRVPEPIETDFVVMWPITRPRLATNITSYGTATACITQKTEVMIQADVHGPASADNAQIISTLFRDQFAVTAFQDTGLDIAPLYTSDPRQMPFENGQQQTEDRWVIDLHMQANIAVTVAQQFAEELEITVEAARTLPAV